VACTHDGNSEDPALKARWQNPHADRRVIRRMQRRTHYLNNMPDPGLSIGGQSLYPQECFNKALETVAALQPPSETVTIKQYTTLELQRLCASCSLSVAEMATVPVFHATLLTEERSKKGTEAVLAQALQPQEDSDNPGVPCY
jgi:hypothetical protein